MNYILFEDNEKARLSKFLHNSYDSIDTEIVFSNSSGNMLSKINELVKSGYVLAMFDFVLDNYDTVMKYRKLCKNISNIKDKCIVVPIPCIEYYVIKVYNEYHNIDFVDLLPSCNNLSYEQYCKSIVKNIKCWKFKRKPCSFIGTNCIEDNLDSLKIKANKIILDTPVFIGTNEYVLEYSNGIETLNEWSRKLLNSYDSFNNMNEIEYTKEFLKESLNLNPVVNI